MLTRVISIATLALSVGGAGCDALYEANKRTVAQRKQDDEQLRIEAGREAAIERARLVSEGYTLLCENIISNTVPNVFGQGNPGYEVGYIDNGFFLDGNDSYFSMGSRLKSGERLRMTQTYALSVTLNKKVITIISINEKGGIIEKRLPCGEEKE